MATKTARRSTALAPRRSSGISTRKSDALKARSASLLRRVRELGQEDEGAMAAIATAGAIGLFEKSGRSLPSYGGIDGKLLWGGGAWFLLRKRKGKTANLGRAAALALTTVAVNQAATRGSLKVSGEDDLDDDDGDEAEVDEL